MAVSSLLCASVYALDVLDTDIQDGKGELPIIQSPREVEAERGDEADSPGFSK